MRILLNFVFMNEVKLQFPKWINKSPDFLHFFLFYVDVLVTFVQPLWSTCLKECSSKTLASTDHVTQVTWFRPSFQVERVYSLNMVIFKTKSWCCWFWYLLYPPSYLFRWPPTSFHCHTEHYVASHVIVLPPRAMPILQVWGLQHGCIMPSVAFSHLSVTSAPCCSFHILL